MLSLPLASGAILSGKWTLGEVLGSGGASIVYAATHRNGHRAALKVLHPALAKEPDQVTRFLREGTFANQIAHPGVVTALDDERTEDGLVYLVMDLLDGRSLADEITERGTLTELEALDIADALLDVLAATHARGLVHRDVKPDNVFLLRAGGVKLLDFGIARATGTSEGSKTMLGAVLGTPGFMPPEQARGQIDAIDARTDVWATAAVLFTMLTGGLVFGDCTPNEALARAILEPAPSLRSVLPTIDPAVAAIVDRGLAFAPENRFPTAATMQAAVRAVRATSLGLPRPSVPGRVVRTAFAVGVVGALAIVGGVARLAFPEAHAQPAGLVASVVATPSLSSPSALPPLERSSPAPTAREPTANRAMSSPLSSTRATSPAVKRELVPALDRDPLATRR